MMEHEHAPAKAIGPHLEAGAVSGKGVLPHGPVGAGGRIDPGQGEDLPLSIRRFFRIVAFPVVEYDLEHPGIGGKLSRVEGLPGYEVAIRLAIAVSDALEITVGRPTCRSAIAFVGRGSEAALLILEYALRVLSLVLVDNGVALVIVALTDQPAKDARGVLRIGVLRVEDPGLICLAVECGNVVARDRAPVDLAGRGMGPALDSGE